ncbi:hypothetical protein [Aquisphaera insulae]|uniref:hypothetical protein n=1 Tax=Aquisphaera insulae TaxID=2712864 RepID=UPI0013EB31DB|nr:hypothetical protein [Aquisphaera insulae]
MNQTLSRTDFRSREPAFARARGPEIVLDRVDPILLVDDAVRAVLATLRPTNRVGRERDASPCFADRLLGVRQAEQLPAGIRAVRIAPQTVVTPLARDLLKKRGIEIRLGVSPELGRLARGEWAFAIGEETGQLQALRRGLLSEPREWLELDPDLEVVGGWLVESSGRGALWVTNDGARTVWRACQSPGVRAAVAAEPSDVHRAVDGLGLNLLVVEPAGKTIALVRQLAAAFRQGGAPGVPADLHEEVLR